MTMLLLVFSLYISGCQNNEMPDVEDSEIDSTEEVQNQENNETEENDTVDQEDENTDEDVDTTDYSNINVTVHDAFDLFMDEYPNAKINEIELEREHNTYEYQIEGYEGTTEYELKIDAFTKEIISRDEDHEEHETGELKREQLDDIEKYVKEALDDAGSGYFVDEWELKVKSDYIKFEIEVENDDGDDIEYKYNYETGELIEKD